MLPTVRSFIHFLLAWVLILPSLGAQVYYVDQGSGCTVGCGGSWANAFSSLREALDSVDQGELWVAAGTYMTSDCDMCTTEDRSRSFRLKNGLALYGGFAGNETNLSERDIRANPTVLSGEIGNDNGRGIEDNAYHVITGVDLDSTTILDGFTIRGGNADGDPAAGEATGGGIWLSSTPGAGNTGVVAPRIRNCIFEANQADLGGGALYLLGTFSPRVDLALENCIFRDNLSLDGAAGGAAGHALSFNPSVRIAYRGCSFLRNEAGDKGGALAYILYNTTADLVLDSCRLDSNAAGNWGGGLLAESSTGGQHRLLINGTSFSNNRAGQGGGALCERATLGAISLSRIDRSAFNANTAGLDGGALYLEGSQSGGTNRMTIVNSLFVKNQAAARGGAFFNTGVETGQSNTGICEPVIVHCTFYRNQASQSGTAVFYNFATPVIGNSILWDGGNEIGESNSQLVLTHSVVEGGYSGPGAALNVINADPVFQAPEADDFRLTPCSPALDIGNPALLPADILDLDADGNTGEAVDTDKAGNLRIAGPAPDAGAFEGSNASPVIDSLLIVGASPSCAGACDGLVEALPVGGEGPFQYLWSTGDTLPGIIGLCAGTYYLTVTDGYGCTSIDSITLIDPEPLDVLLAGPEAICAGDTARLTATASGGSGSYFFSWNSDPLSGATLVVSPGQTARYGFQATDGNGCQTADSITVQVNPLPVPSLPESVTICPGDSAVLDPGPFAAYAWSTGDTTRTVTALDVGFFEVTVTSEDGCRGVALKEVMEFIGTKVRITGDTAICPGEATQLDAGIFPAYQWSNGAATRVLPVSNPGRYAVTVTDPEGCRSVDSVFVRAFQPIELTIRGDSAICVGDSLVLFAEATGGGGGFSFSWNGDAVSGSVFRSQPAGTGVVLLEVSDTNGCRAAISETAIVRAAPRSDLPPTAGICPGDSVMLSPGTFRAYLWSTGDTTPTITVAEPGNYEVLITGANGCQGVSGVEVSAFGAPPVRITGDTAICPGGVAILDAGPFAEYQWANGAAIREQRVFSTGRYAVTVTDTNGCRSSDSIEVVLKDSLNVQIAGADVLCPGDSLVLDAGPFSLYQWSDGSTGRMLTVREGGTFMVAVRDEEGCVGAAEVTIMQRAFPADLLGRDTILCWDDSLQVGVQGFATYRWSTGSAASAIIVTGPQLLALTVTDSFGCTAEDSLLIETTALPEVVIRGDTVICPGEVALFEADAVGSYRWSTGSTLPVIEVQEPGTYRVEVTGPNGCTGTDSLRVEVLEAPQVRIQGELFFCLGDSLRLEVGAFAQYAWSDGGTGAAITVRESGDYAVTVTAANGCRASDTVSVETGGAASVMIEGNRSICGGGTTVLTAPSFASYLWSTGEREPAITVSEAGTYGLTVTDETGCRTSAEAEVFDTLAPAGQIDLAADRICPGEVAVLSASGNGQLQWLDTSGTLEVIDEESALATPLATTTYFLVVDNGCGVDTFRREVRVFPPADLGLGPDRRLKAGESLQLNARGGSGYEWIRGGEYLSCQFCPDPVARPEGVALFVVEAVDGNGCLTRDSLTIRVLPPLADLIRVYNVITPNGDGRNDVLFVEGLEYFSETELSVLNRWGTTVFESRDYQNDWDGTYEGRPLPAGPYVVILVVKEGAEKIVIRETLTIIRS